MYKLEESQPTTRGCLSVLHQREVFHASLRPSDSRACFEVPLDSD